MVALLKRRKWCRWCGAALAPIVVNYDTGDVWVGCVHCDRVCRVPSCEVCRVIKERTP